MSNLEQFCFLVVERQKANTKRRRLLSYLNKKINKNRHLSDQFIKANMYTDELKTYREFADEMKKIAKRKFSPMRKELKISVKYNSNNQCQSLIHDGITYLYKDVKRMSDAYLFDTIVLDKERLENPYAHINEKKDLT